MPTDNSGSAVGNANVVGFSRGYVEFLWNPRKRTLTPWLSANGLTWKAGPALDLRVWAPEFKGLPANYDDCEAFIDNFQEGTGSLLLAAHVECGGRCGPIQSSAWVSSDGLSWIPATVPATVSAALVSGGSSGFIALGSSGSKPTIWTSANGRTWAQGALPPAVLAAGAYVSDPVSISGGFVLPGVIRLKKGHRTEPDGCSGSLYDLSQYQGALWWSADDTTWTRDTVSGTNPTYRPIDMSVVRIDDHTVVALQYAAGKTTEWVSANGRTWTRLTGNPVDTAARQAYWVSSVIFGWDRGLIRRGSTLSVFNSRLAPVTLRQTGDSPWWDEYLHLVMGPSGILATDGGIRFWVGVPTAA